MARVAGISTTRTTVASSSSETAVPRTSDQKNGPKPNSVIFESAITNANRGPRMSDPVVISLNAAMSAGISASPAIARSSTGGTSTERSAAVPANSAISTPVATGRKTAR